MILWELFIQKNNSSFVIIFLPQGVTLVKRVVRQILLVRNHRQDFLHAKKRNPGYD